MKKSLEGYELPVAALAAAITHAGEKNVRFYLNGVYLDFPLGRIVASDGHRLFCGSIPRADFAPIIVPRDLVTATLKAWRGLKARERDQTAAIAVNVTGDAPVRRVAFAVVTAGVRFEEKEIDAKYVEYERVIPLKPSGEVGQYNPRYILDASDSLAVFGGFDKSKGCASVWRNGTSAALVTRGGVQALAVVMPMRVDDEPADLTWFTGKPVKPTAV